jgi:hypothetical protein
MSLSPSGIPLLDTNQAGKEETANEAILRIEALSIFPVLSRTTTAPPSSPIDGDLYIVPANPSGAWAGQTGKFAHRLNGGWNFYAPVDGQKIWSKADSAFVVYTESSNTWAIVPGTGDMSSSVYDTDDDGIVDAAESISGSPSGDNVYGIKDGVKGWQSFPAWVRSVPLFGLVTGSNTAISDSNTIIQAFQNLQAQISAILTGGRLIPPGGTSGQVLKKSTNGDYAVGWGDDNAGTSGSSAFTGLADTFSSFTGRASQFLRVNSAGTLIESIALGAAAFLKPGTDPGDLLQRDVDGRYPAGDGRNITAINAGNIATGTLDTARLDTGTTAGKVVVVGVGGQIDPAIVPSTTSGSSTIEPVQIVSTSSVALTRSSFGDQNDLFYYLGTNELSTTWSNPATNGRLTIVSNSNAGSGGVSRLTDRDFISDNNQTNNSDSQVVYDLGASNFKLNGISIRCQRNGGSQTLTVEYSNDNANWTTATSGTTVGGNFGDAWTHVTVTLTPNARYWRITLVKSGTSFSSWGEIQMYGEYTPTTVSSIPVSPAWGGKLAYNNLYTNNFTLTIPDTTTGFPAGFFFWLRDDSASGTITVSPQNGNVTVTSPNGNTLTKDDLYLVIHNGSKSWFVQRVSALVRSIGSGLILSNSGQLSLDTSVVPSTLYNGLVYHFPFDNFAYSIAQPATFNNAITANNYNSSPKLGTRCLVNTGSGYSLDSNFWRTVNFNRDFGVAFWFYPTATTGGSSSSPFAIDFLNAGGSAFWMIIINFFSRNSAGSGTAVPRLSTRGNIDLQLTNNQVPLNAWCHVAVRYSASSRNFVLSINGVHYSASGTIDPSLADENSSSACRVYLFGGSSGASDILNHTDRLDQLLYWYRRPTDSEIAALYNNGNGLEL